MNKDIFEIKAKSIIPALKEKGWKVNFKEELLYLEVIKEVKDKKTGKIKIKTKTALTIFAFIAFNGPQKGKKRWEVVTYRGGIRSIFDSLEEAWELFIKEEKEMDISKLEKTLF